MGLARVGTAVLSRQDLADMSFKASHVTIQLLNHCKRDGYRTLTACPAPQALTDAMTFSRARRTECGSAHRVQGPHAGQAPPRPVTRGTGAMPGTLTAGKRPDVLNRSRRTRVCRNLAPILERPVCRKGHVTYLRFCLTTRLCEVDDFTRAKCEPVLARSALGV